MALIKCPECGKNVSEKVEFCPHCGYNVQKYYQEIEEAKEKRKKYLAQKELEERCKITSLKPTKPKFYLEIFPVLAGVFLICYGIVIGHDYYKIKSWIMILSGIVWLLLAVYLIYKKISTYNKLMSEYELAQADYNAYYDMKQKQRKEEREKYEREELNRQIELSKNAKCPYCNSHNTTKISVTSKAVDTAMFGVFGQKRKYQWHCNNCKSDF